MNLHADVRAIRAVAPKGASWLVVTVNGWAYWQDCMGTGSLWVPPFQSMSVFASLDFPRRNKFAISLTEGSVHLQDESGKITEVPQSAWVAARRRKGRK